MCLQSRHPLFSYKQINDIFNDDSFTSQDISVRFGVYMQRGYVTKFVNIGVDIGIIGAIKSENR